MSNDPKDFVFPNPLVDGWSSYGLTKREFFAAIALHAMIVAPDGLSLTIGSITANALATADSLLKKLEDKPDGK